MSYCEKNKSANSEALTQRGIFWYDKRLKERAAELRNNLTPAEKIIWREVLSKRPNEYKFIRQKPVGYYILDFYCSKLLFAIEIDGPIHDIDKQYDIERDTYLKACGIKVLRLNNKDVLKSIDSVKSKILSEIEILKINPINPP